MSHFDCRHSNNMLRHWGRQCPVSRFPQQRCTRNSFSTPERGMNHPQQPLTPLLDRFLSNWLSVCLAGWVSLSVFWQNVRCSNSGAGADKSRPTDRTTTASSHSVTGHATVKIRTYSLLYPQENFFFSLSSLHAYSWVCVMCVRENAHFCVRYRERHLAQRPSGTVNVFTSTTVTWLFAGFLVS